MRGSHVTITKPMTFFIEECCNCGVLFGMTDEFHDQRLKDGNTRTFYCPNGHNQHYLKKSDAQLRKEAEAKFVAEQDQHEATRRDLRALQRRVKKGVCPCCHRSFVQLSRHMKSQHPNYGP